MLAGRVWRDDRLCAPLGEPVTQALGIVGSISDEARRTGHDGEQGTSAVEVMGVAGRELKSDRPTEIVAQRVDFGRATAARTANGVAEGPPFAPAAERCALMCVESTATVPIMPVEPVNA